MSLINDALKQTKQSQPQNPPVRPPSLPPAEATAPAGGNWLAPVVIILLLAVAAIFVGLSLSKRALPVAAATKVHPMAVTLPKVTNPPPGSNVVAVVSPRPLDLKLQGILLAARPCAIVNGKTVFVGDQVSGWQVTAISKDSVTLQRETETKVLGLSPR